MKRFKNILVVLDWQNIDQPLMERGLRLAEQNHAKICFVETFDDLPQAHQVGFIDFDRFEALYFESIEQHIAQLNHKVQPWRSKGIEIEVSALIGSPIAEISNKVSNNNCDLIMIGLETGEESNGPLLAGLPLRLMRKSPCAVWAMRPTEPTGFNRIIAAVDPKDQTEEECRLFKNIMEIATSLAISENSELHVLHAWSLYGEAVFQGQIPDDELNKWLDREKEKCTKLLMKLLKPYEKHIDRVHIHKGPADLLLPLFVKHFKSDLLILGTIGRSGIPGILIGNTAEKILQTVECSVLTVKTQNLPLNS